VSVQRDLHAKVRYGQNEGKRNEDENEDKKNGGMSSLTLRNAQHRRYMNLTKGHSLALQKAKKS
jgi:hypothetical protein